MQTILVTPAPLTVNATPSWEQLQTWWEALWRDPADVRCAFSDLMPRALPRFLESDVLLVLIMAEADCVAGIWLHDLERTHGCVTTGWIGGWIAPAWRGPLGCTAAKLALAAFQARGVQHIFAAINTANKPSLALVLGRSMLGFTRVMRYPDFLPYHGVTTECVITTWHPEDRALAYEAATRRAQQAARLQSAISAC